MVMHVSWKKEFLNLFRFFGSLNHSLAKEQLHRFWHHFFKKSKMFCYCSSSALCM